MDEVATEKRIAEAQQRPAEWFRLTLGGVSRPKVAFSWSI